MCGSIGQFPWNSVLVDDVGASAHWKFEAILGEKSWAHFETQQFMDGRETYWRYGQTWYIGFWHVLLVNVSDLLGASKFNIASLMFYH